MLQFFVMANSKAQTVAEYLNELSEDRKQQIQEVRKIILENLPEGYEEGVHYGMITYYVPLSIFPEGYLNKKDTPLPYAALASQKNHMAVYLNCLYSDPTAYQDFIEQYKTSGKKMDIGKSCVRFKKVDDLPLDLIGKTIAETPVDKYINMYTEAIKK